DLTHFVAAQPADPTRRAAWATKAVLALAETVGYCHRLTPPVVHRDLKPANVLLAPTPVGAGRLKITDFGISDVLARQAPDEAQRVTQAHAAPSTPTLLRWAHTPLYASPQQKQGADADPREAEWEWACRGGTGPKEDGTYDFYPDRPTNDLSSTQANFD